MDKSRTVELQNTIIKMLLDTIENLESEITQLRKLTDGTACAAEDSNQQLKDEVAKLNQMLFGDTYPMSE